MLDTMFGMQRLLIGLVAIAGLAVANDSWPQWRGPSLN